MKFATFVTVEGESKPEVVPDGRDSRTTVMIPGQAWDIAIWADGKPLVSINISDNGRMVLTNHKGCFEFAISQQVDLHQSRPWNKT